MHTFPTPPENTRLGFHYFQDTNHYRDSDLVEWLPRLQALGASWLILPAPTHRAIPEVFVQGLMAANIEPVFHFHLPVEGNRADSDLRVLFASYARWGAHYAILFDRPNLRTAWQARSWAQADLVERFLDRFILSAHACLEEGLLPVFPALEPGGDYWDTAFLRSALRGLQRRGETQVLENMAFGAGAAATNRPLNWGSGGPQNWPQARPYSTPIHTQDQVGFRSFDWTTAIIQAELGAARPILALYAGSCKPALNDPRYPQLDLVAHAKRCLEIARCLAGDLSPDSAGEERLDPIPPEVLAVDFWLLSAENHSPAAEQAWYTGGASLPAAIALQKWSAARRQKTAASQSKSSKQATVASGTDQSGGAAEGHAQVYDATEGKIAGQLADAADSSSLPPAAGTQVKHPIAHYLLLPLYSWGVAGWDIDMLSEILREAHPTIGFSLAEAALAERVTVVANAQAIPEDALDNLRKSGCLVERYLPAGTPLASR